MADTQYYSTHKGFQIDDAVYRALPLGEGQNGSSKGSSHNFTDLDKFDYKIGQKQDQVLAGQGISIPDNKTISVNVDGDLIQFDSNKLTINEVKLSQHIAPTIAGSVEGLIDIKDLRDSSEYANRAEIATAYQRKLDVDADSGIIKSLFDNNKKIKVYKDDATIKFDVSSGLYAEDVKLASVYTSTGGKTLKDIIPTITEIEPAVYDVLITEDNVNSKIASQTGAYRGGYDSYADLFAKYPVDPAGTQMYPKTVPGTSVLKKLRNNDYAYVGEPDSEGVGYWMVKYKAVGEMIQESPEKWEMYEWSEEYRFRVAAFTERENAAIQSGITAEKVAKYDEMCMDALTVSEGNILYKKIQTPVVNPGQTGKAIEFISDLSQDAQGVISPVKKLVREANMSVSGLFTSEGFRKLAGITAGANKVEAEVPTEKELQGWIKITDPDGTIHYEQIYKLHKAGRVDSEGNVGELGGVIAGPGLAISDEGILSVVGGGGGSSVTEYTKKVVKDSANPNHLTFVNVKDGGETQIDYTPTSTSGVGDVQIDGATIVASGVANIPLANTTAPGAVQLGENLSVSADGKKVNADNTTYEFTMDGNYLKIWNNTKKKYEYELKVQKTYGLHVTDFGAGIGADKLSIVDIVDGTASLHLPTYRLERVALDASHPNVYDTRLKRIYTVEDSSHVLHTTEVLVDTISAHDATCLAETTGVANEHFKTFSVDKYGHVLEYNNKNLARGLALFDSDTGTTVVANGAKIGHTNYTNTGTVGIGTQPTKAGTADGFNFKYNEVTEFIVPRIQYDAYGHVTNIVTNDSSLLGTRQNTVRIPVFTGATKSGTVNGYKGLVPQPLADASHKDYEKFLRGDGTWAYAGKKFDVTLTLPASAGTVAATGTDLVDVTADMRPLVDVLNNGTTAAERAKINEAWSRVYRAQTVAGGINFYVVAGTAATLTVQVSL